MVNPGGPRKESVLIQVAGGLLALVILAALIGPFLSPYGYDQVTEKQFAPPSLQHWFGTDLHGRDVFTRVIYGARVSLMVGLVGSLVSLIVGTTYGMVSGYVGGRLDDIMMRIVDILYSLPRLVIVILLIGVFDQQMKSFLEWFGSPKLVAHSRLIVLFIGLGMVEWLTMARIIRGQVLSLKEQTFVQASRALGQKPWKIILLHLLPNLRGIIIVYLTLTIPTVILEESFLSFLGLGVQAPQSSWGTLLSDGASMINPVRIAWWLLLGPALFMAVTLLSLNFIGDGLRDRFDPRSRSR
jgi:peptide/nickel transport system permease protein/oligopeptide transport system permease protein